MIVLDSIPRIKPMNIPRIVCTIGVFDGVHRGHRHILSALKRAAERHKGTSVVITFNKHPYSVIHPKIHIPMLTAPEHKLALLESLGIDISVMINFTKAFASTPATVWIRDMLWEQMHIKAVCIGENSFFGRNRSGNMQILSKWGRQLGFEVISTGILRIDNTPVNSTIIRELIAKGNLSAAEKFLGRPYSVTGRRIKGEGVGIKIGFPTINIDMRDRCIPPPGVYAVTIKTDTGRRYYAAANISRGPTFGRKGNGPVFEIHIPSGEIIPPEKKIEAIFTRKIRDKQEFTSKEQLVERIRQDIDETKKIFSGLQ